MFGDNQRNLRSGRFRVSKRKYYFEQPSYEKPHPCYKMSWMLKTKIDLKDDPVIERKLFGRHKTK